MTAKENIKMDKAYIINWITKNLRPPDVVSKKLLWLLNHHDIDEAKLREACLFESPVIALHRLEMLLLYGNENGDVPEDIDEKENKL